jgi:hypothetical protein
MRYGNKREGVNMGYCHNASGKAVQAAGRTCCGTYQARRCPGRLQRVSGGCLDIQQRGGYSGRVQRGYARAVPCYCELRHTASVESTTGTGGVVQAARERKGQYEAR